MTGNIYKWKAHKLRASFNKPDQLLSDGRWWICVNRSFIYKNWRRRATCLVGLGTGLQIICYRMVDMDMEVGHSSVLFFS